ncbi:MAG: glycine betaine/L-proline ABC transporter ATP-binding protein [Mesorhizobium sp.]|uniref:quaternary amine ABC transporter ATP-binding protein n=1 Tax=Mesorhizobium sp. TaxID=1871066 RepID=UPI000FE72C7C|nr:glycine betaine/L-proline ABC transporter ATP-binding protein [Mesorhizobium sp.]RWA96712.1 MAG: glycine betaine/L-proline ABC transporter ATP-binding protein [Mesorhizobium sp.]RWE17453.1 MAG: glycine betaine/L-proline ABC transporter ATP-binding protein [Mesorhizobium sp.]TJW89530.1 MAG: glycine betaine/L-proline ABC transporter ATP-binding protein [Mesorhizobium sp.]
MTSNNASIEIRDLYKIFGKSPEKYVEAVRGGMTKAELSKAHGQILGLNNINISMPAGKIQVVMGLSGSGKSTLIRHINRLIEPTSGSIMIDGRDVLEMSELELREFRRNHTAMVFQRFGLLPHRTVIDNVTFGLEVRGVEAAKSRDTAMRWIDRVGLSGFETRYPNELSGGMQQRVGLARALSNNASILLMDEAYSALDPLIRTDMQTMLLELQTELKKTIVFITHDLDEALRLGDQIVILRDGSIIQQGNSQDILLRPADDYIERFVKDVNRGRFIKVDAVMEPPPQSDGRSLPSLKSGLTLETAAKELTNSNFDSAYVTGDGGQPLGLISLRQITAALSSGSAA